MRVYVRIKNLKYLAYHSFIIFCSSIFILPTLSYNSIAASTKKYYNNSTHDLNGLSKPRNITLAADLPETAASPSPPGQATSSGYVIGPLDTLRITVHGNPNLSGTIIVRPDGRITTPLVEDTIAANKTPEQLARDLENRLRSYVLAPRVTVDVVESIGPLERRIRVVGSAGQVGAMPYRDGMTLLDVIIQAGGLLPFAAGNDAVVYRQTSTGTDELPVRLDDLVGEGDPSANIVMQPGDIVLIPESFFAGEWKAEGTVGAFTSYTDNVNLDPDGEKDQAAISAVQPTISIRGQTARTNAALDAGVAAGYQYLSNEGPVVLPELLGLSKTELSRDLFFVDAAASVTSENLDVSQGSSGAAGNTADLNLVQTYLVSPYLLNRLGSFANMETRYLFGAAKSSNADFFGNGNNDDRNNEQLSDAIINGVSLGIASGRDFTRVPWLFRLGADRTIRFGANNVDRAYAVMSPEFVINSKFSLLGDFGYEVLDDGDKNLSGPTAMGGVQWDPSPSFSARALYGLRLENQAGEAEIRYDIGPRTTIVATAEERVETGQESLIENVSTLGLNPTTGEFVDRRTNLAYIPRPTSVNITDSLTRTRRGQLTLTHTTSLDVFSVSAFASDQKDLDDDDNNNNTDDNRKTWGGSVDWERQLDNLTTLDIRAQYTTGDNASSGRNNNSSSGGDFDRYRFQITLNRILTEHVLGYVSYSFQRQFADNNDDEYTENAVFIGLTYAFNL